MEVPQNSLQSFEEMLVATYPSLFPKDVEGHPIDPCCGIECSTGWENLVLNLCGAIVSYQKSCRYVKTHPPTVCINQIKEKFGSLRFYISGGDRHIRGMIDFAEFLSLRTCQITGKSGVLCRKGSWYQTLSLDKQCEFGYTTVNKDENHAI
jgi:hypothetical protein